MFSDPLERRFDYRDEYSAIAVAGNLQGNQICPSLRHDSCYVRAMIIVSPIWSWIRIGIIRCIGIAVAEVVLIDNPVRNAIIIAIRTERWVIQVKTVVDHDHGIP